MIFHAFYNPDNIGDILLIRLGEGKTSTYETYSDVIVLKDESGKIIGYNIFNASHHVTALSSGMVTITQTLVSECNALLSTYDLRLVESDYKEKFVVGKVIEVEAHPDSDHLHVCQVDLQSEVTQIVCGASNVEKGQLVIVAIVGAVLPSGMIIKPSKLRKVSSNGMLCSARELLLEGDFNTQGIVILDDNKYQIGQLFYCERGEA